MSTDTPITDDVLTHNVGYANYQLDMLVNESRKLERENARLREEVEMLNVRHAAAMLHAQTHADEYNALREDEKGLLQDIQRLTEEAFKRDEELALTTGTLESRERNIATLQEELAEAKRGSDRLLSAMQAEEEKLRPLIEKSGCDPQHHGADIAIMELLNLAEQAEARALANEKDAGRYRWLRGGNSGLPQNWALPWGDALDAAIDAAIGANFDTAIDSALKASAQEGQ